MARTKRKVRSLPTIWEVSDNLWAIIQGILNEYDAPASTGRPRVDQRAALNGIIFQMRSGCQWNHLPEKFGDDASVHRTLQRWVSKGIFEHIWAALVAHCDEWGGVDWEWQSADGALGKARFGGTMLAPIPRIAAKRARSAA